MKVRYVVVSSGQHGHLTNFQVWIMLAFVVAFIAILKGRWLVAALVIMVALMMAGGVETAHEYVTTMRP